MANEQANQQESQLLPIVDLKGIEYFVDVDRRQFRAVNDIGNTVGFHTMHGRDMVKAMMDTEWRRFAIDPPKETPEKVVECAQCGCRIPAAKT